MLRPGLPSRVDYISWPGSILESRGGLILERAEETEGYRKDGPVSVAKFELGESDEAEQREARALRQRQASDVIEQLLGRIG